MNGCLISCFKNEGQGRRSYSIIVLNLHLIIYLYFQYSSLFPNIPYLNPGSILLDLRNFNVLSGVGLCEIDYVNVTFVLKCLCFNFI